MRQRFSGLVLAAAALCALAGSTGTASASTSPVEQAHPQLVRAFTGTGCHTYNYWNGAHVCITVVGNGLNMQSATGETDGPDSDWVEIWDTEGVVAIWGHPANHYMTIDWSSGGGVWLANGDNVCFSDTTLNQTACLTMHP